MMRDPDALLPLTPVAFHILLALAQGTCHGYAVMRQVSVATPQTSHVGTTTIYRAISRLVAAGLVADAGKRPSRLDDDERRRYYRLTPWGLLVAQAEARRLAQLVGYARAALPLADAEMKGDAASFQVAVRG